MTEQSIEHFASAAREAKSRVERLKFLHARGETSYDELAQAGKEFSAAFYDYQKAKFPKQKARRISYMSVIR